MKKITYKKIRIFKQLVILNEKPLLTDALLEHITNGIHLEPIIMDRPEQIIVGY